MVCCFTKRRENLHTHSGYYAIHLLLLTIFMTQKQALVEILQCTYYLKLRSATKHHGAKSFLRSQQFLVYEIPVFYVTRKIITSPYVPVLNQMNPTNTLTSYCPKISFNTILPFMPRSSKVFPSFKLSCVFFSSPYAPDAPLTLSSFNYINLIIISEEHSSWISQLYSFIHHPCISPPSFIGLLRSV